MGLEYRAKMGSTWTQPIRCLQTMHTIWPKLVSSPTKMPSCCMQTTGQWSWKVSSKKYGPYYIWSMTSPWITVLLFRLLQHLGICNLVVAVQQENIIKQRVVVIGNGFTLGDIISIYIFLVLNYFLCCGCVFFTFQCFKEWVIMDTNVFLYLLP